MSHIHIIMPIILIIEKTGTVKPLTLKEYKKDDLYKKAGFKNADGFISHCEWTSSTTTTIVDVDAKGTEITNMTSNSTGSTSYTVTVYGKTTGRAGQENKYDFPPPIDNTLFFGACLIVATNETDTCIDLPVSTWNKMYEQLFGGFEDLGSEDTESDDDNDEDADLPRTKEGYAKDGFIVDDDVEEDLIETETETETELDEDEDDSEYSDEKPKKRKLRKPIKNAPVKKTTTKTEKPVKTTKKTEKTTKKNAPENVFVATEQSVNEFLDCTSELSEEEYFA